MASTSSTTAQQETPESFESLANRNAAVKILQSYEKLSWISFERCEVSLYLILLIFSLHPDPRLFSNLPCAVSDHDIQTIQQTRLHFQNLVAGFTAEDEAATILWKEDFTKHPVAASTSTTDESSGKKGKGRASLGNEKSNSRSVSGEKEARASSSKSSGAGARDKGKGREMI